MEIGVKKLVIGLGILVLVSILGFTFKSYSETPNFCRSCHLMEEGYQSWSNSAHYEVACVECHAHPGFKGYLRAKVAGIRQASIYFTNSPKPPGTKTFMAEVENKRCLGCHSAISEINGIAKKDLPESLKNIGLNMGHRAHMKSGVKCSTCHQADAHGNKKSKDKLTGKNKIYKRDVMQELDTCPKKKEVICFNCHNGKFYNGKKPGEDCSTCHET